MPNRLESGSDHHRLEHCGPSIGRHKISLDHPDFFAMSRSLPNAIDDALDTLYEPNAVFSPVLWSASMTSFCLLFSLLPLLVLFSLLLLPFFFSFLFCFSAFIYFLSSLYLILFSLFLLQIDLRQSVVHMRCDRYYVQYIRGIVLGGKGYYSRFFQA